MPLMRGRELKLPTVHLALERQRDAPYAGARIETVDTGGKTNSKADAPFSGGGN